MKYDLFNQPTITSLENELTQGYVKSLFDYKEGLLYWKVSKGRRGKIGNKAGYLHKNKDGCRYSIMINSKSYLCSRIIFLWHNGYLPEIVDHKNRIKIDDRIENLRAATDSQNNKNTSSRKNSSSKYLGVSLVKKGQKWIAIIQTDGKLKILGRFKVEKDAALAYNEAALIHHGEFAHLNIIT